MGKIIVISAALAGLFYLIKFSTYGISQEFGLGFLAGAILIGSIVAIGAHIEMKDQLAKQRDELTRDL